MKRTLACICLVLLFATTFALAWGEMPYTDAQVVQRSDRIVIAHIKDGSLKIKDLGSSYESHAVLVVTSTLKGEGDAKEISINIHYGLLPVPAAYKDKPDQFVGKAWPDDDSKAGTISLCDDNPSEGTTKITGDDDLRQDHVWLLRQFRDNDGKISHDHQNTDALSVWDPEDVQPASKEKALRALIK